MVEYKKIEFYVPCDISNDKMDEISENVISSAENMYFKHGDEIVVNDIRLKVNTTMPVDGVKIDRNTVIELVREFAGKDVIFGIDTSYSMSNTDVLPSRFDICKKLVLLYMKHKLNTNDRVGVILFGTTSETVIEMDTVNEEKINTVVNKLNDIKPRGRSFYIPVFETSIEMFSKSIDRHKFLILLTDGGIAEKINIGEKMRDEGIIVHAVTIGKPKSEDIKTLTEIISITGGRVIELSDTIVSQLFTELGEYKIPEKGLSGVEIPVYTKSGISSIISNPTVKKIIDKMWG